MLFDLASLGVCSDDAVRGSAQPSVARQLAGFLPPFLARALFEPLRSIEATSNFADDNGVGNASLAWTLPLGRPTSLTDPSRTTDIFSERFYYGSGFDTIGVFYASRVKLRIPLTLWRCGASGSPPEPAARGEIRLPATQQTDDGPLLWCWLNTVVYWTSTLAASGVPPVPMPLGPFPDADFRVGFGVPVGTDRGRPLTESDAYVHVRPNYAWALAAYPDEPEDLLCSVRVPAVASSTQLYVDSHGGKTGRVPVDADAAVP